MQGLEFTDLMRLKRVPRRNTAMPGSAGALSSTTSTTNATANGSPGAAGG
jgi:hypothetical protein